MTLETGGSGSRLINTWIQITLGLAIFFWGVYAFFYEKQYVPNHMPPAVVITSSMQEMSDARALTAIKGTITLRNTSKTHLWIVSSWYNAYGLHITQSERDEDAFAKYVHTGIAAQQESFARHFDSTAEVVLASRLSPDSAWLEPEEEWTEQFQLYVPRGKYDSIDLEVDLSAAKENRFLGTKWLVGPDKDYPALLPGAIWIQPCVKASETESDHAKCELVDVEKNIKHRKLEQKYSMVYNRSSSFLLLTGPTVVKRSTPQ